MSSAKGKQTKKQRKKVEALRHYCRNPQITMNRPVGLIVRYTGYLDLPPTVIPFDRLCVLLGFPEKKARKEACDVG